MGVPGGARFSNADDDQRIDDGTGRKYCTWTTSGHVGHCGMLVAVCARRHYGIGTAARNRRSRPGAAIPDVYADSSVGNATSDIADADGGADRPDAHCSAGAQSFALADPDRADVGNVTDHPDTHCSAGAHSFPRASAINYDSNRGSRARHDHITNHNHARTTARWVHAHNFSDQSDIKRRSFVECSRIRRRADGVYVHVGRASA